MARPPQLRTREKRLGAIGGYFGEVAPLIAELQSGQSSDRIRTFAQIAPDDIVQALHVLAGIAGAGIVVHGGRGCAGALTRFAPNGRWAVSNLDQRDTILGSDGALADTVRGLYRRERPWAIFIVATPVIAINNDDVRSAAIELSDELDIPVIEVISDGFRSKIAATGFDAAAQAALQLVTPAEAAPRRDLVNLLAVDGGPGVADIAAQLRALGLEVNPLPHGADAEGFRRAASAALSVTLDADANEAFGRGLERTHGVAFLPLPPPIGSAATQHFLAAVAEATDHAAPAPLAETAAPQVLRGRRVVIAAPPAAAFGLADLIDELGGTLAGVSVDHIDAGHLPALQDFAARRPGVPLHVADGQPFEHANRLARLLPDLLIGSAELAVLAARAGIPAVALRPEQLYGSIGVAQLARRAARALHNVALVQRLSAARSAPYRPGWFKRSPDWHIKLEVK
ncbi:MAG TPA: nitrogenase component 1 [Rhodopseudomonas sp.]|uniref:nitrogenase component 1 n=1 Tax=Rhodopseudomonas sp. TaxID=1078 RepID=UPI002ED88F2C